MAKLKLNEIPDNKPVKLTLELPAAVHRDLAAYAEALAQETGDKVDAVGLIAPMLSRFMATDRGFAKIRRTMRQRAGAPQTLPPTPAERGE